MRSMAPVSERTRRVAPVPDSQKANAAGGTVVRHAEDYPRETGQKEPEQETMDRQIAPRHSSGGQDVGQALADYPVYAGHALEKQPEGYPAVFILLVPFLILTAAIILLAFYHTPVQSQVIVPGGDPTRGKAALQTWGCGSCHTIDGVPGANGTVGPSLNALVNRSFIGGHLQNTPDNLMLWIMNPQSVSPGVDMPNTGVPLKIARDMAAYLYSIK